MKVFSVAGYTKSGKTTLVTGLISELKRRGYTVGSVKDIHFESFAIDGEATNTAKHRKAGAEIVTARGNCETDIMFPFKMDLARLLSFYNTDYVIIEGAREPGLPKIITAKTTDEIDELADGSVFLVSGLVAERLERYGKFEVMNALTDIEAIADTVEEKVFDVLPLLDAECCGACGGCGKMCVGLLSGSMERSACVAEKGAELYIDGKSVQMAEFVQKILKNAVEGVVKELKGYKRGAKITVKI